MTDWDVYTPPQWIKHQRQAEYAPTKWWRVLLPDGSIWMETSDEDEVRRDRPEGARVQRLYERCAHQWRDDELL